MVDYIKSYLTMTWSQKKVKATNSQLLWGQYLSVCVQYASLLPFMSIFMRKPPNFQSLVFYSSFLPKSWFLINFDFQEVSFDFCHKFPLTSIIYRSWGALRAVTSSWRPFGPAWLRPLRSSGAQAMQPTPHPSWVNITTRENTITRVKAITEVNTISRAYTITEANTIT